MSKLTLAAAALAAAVAAPAAAQTFPDKPIRMIVPFEPGGMSDTFSRVIQKSVEQRQLLPQPIVVVNMQGAGGSVGARTVKDAPPDGHTIMMFHVGLLSGAAMKVIDYDPLAAFIPVAEVGGSCTVYVVKGDAPYQSLRDFVDAVKAKPNTVRDATNIGAVAHFASLVLARATGMQLRFVQVGGGAARNTQILGGHVKSTILAVSEYAAFKPGVRALALLAPERDPFVPDIPTAKELGYDVTFCSNNWIFAPRATPADRVAKLADVFEKIMADPAVRQDFASRSQNPTFVRGAALEKKVADTFAEVQAVAASIQKPQ